MSARDSAVWVQVSIFSPLPIDRLIPQCTVSSEHALHSIPNMHTEYITGNDLYCKSCRMTEFIVWIWTVCCVLYVPNVVLLVTVSAPPGRCRKSERVRGCGSQWIGIPHVYNKYESSNRVPAAHRVRTTMRALRPQLWSSLSNKGGGEL